MVYEKARKVFEKYNDIDKIEDIDVMAEKAYKTLERKGLIYDKKNPNKKCATVADVYDAFGLNSKDMDPSFVVGRRNKIRNLADVYAAYECADVHLRADEDEPEKSLLEKALDYVGGFVKRHPVASSIGVGALAFGGMLGAETVHNYLSDGDFTPGEVSYNEKGHIDGNVDGPVVGDVDGDVDGDFLGDIDGNVDGPVVGDVDGDMDGDIAGSYAGAVEADVDGDFDGDWDGDVLGTYQGDVEADVDGDVLGDVLGDVDGDVLGDIDGDVDGDVDGPIVGTYAGTYTGAYTGTYIGEFSGDVAGDIDGAINGSVDADITRLGNVSAYFSGIIHYGNGDVPFEGEIEADDLVDALGITGTFQGIADLGLVGTVDGIMNGTVDGTMDGDMDGTTNADFDGVVDAIIDANVDAVVDAIVDAELDAVIDAEIVGTTNGDVNLHVENGKLNGTTQSHMSGQANGQMNANYNGALDAEIDAMLDANLRASVNGEINAEVDAVVDAYFDGGIDAAIETNGGINSVGGYILGTLGTTLTSLFGFNRAKRNDEKKAKKIYEDKRDSAKKHIQAKKKSNKLSTKIDKGFGGVKNQMKKDKEEIDKQLKNVGLGDMPEDLEKDIDDFANTYKAPKN